MHELVFFACVGNATQIMVLGLGNFAVISQPFNRFKKRDKPRRKRPDIFFEAAPEVVKVFDDGREVCNTGLAQGTAEYKRRIVAMWIRQLRLCCNCQKDLRMSEATFEHENGRCAGRRDDRIEVDGKPINGASHGICNAERGSKRTPIWHGPGQVSGGL